MIALAVWCKAFGSSVLPRYRCSSFSFCSMGVIAKDFYSYLQYTCYWYV